ncbi:MAG TPA: enoyl-CoA hydratase/isomerase family protein [Solirubrobacteraceae bacterium]|nr:enoyl-CoA hydratase/isomerase family protein [Solirubrobacteraceae bacterium]
MSQDEQVQALPSLSREDDVFVLDLGNGENRFNAASLDAIERCLDEVQGAPAPRALVTTATGKIFSNGLDLEWMAANQGLIAEFVPRLHELLARVLELDVPCVAALQGHTFAAGAMLALAHDQRVMRADRGFFCLPEVDIRIPFTHGMNALIAARLSKRAAHEAMTTGRRYGGIDAEAAGIVAHAVAEDRVRAQAIELASALAGKDPATLGTIKRRLYEAPLAALRDRGANELVGAA